MSANERLNFAFYLAKRFQQASIGNALDLLKIADAEQKRNELLCSVEMSEEETARQEKRHLSRKAKATLIGEEMGADIYFQGDPRGCPVYVCTPGYATNALYSSEGLPVPGRGFTSAQMERMTR